MRDSSIDRRQDRQASFNFDARTFLGISALILAAVVAIVVYVASPI